MRSGRIAVGMLAVAGLVSVGMAGAVYAKDTPGKVVAHLKTSKGEDAGTATFQESKDGKQLSIKLSLKNIPFGEHAVHIHQTATCDAPDFKGAGGHFNPDSKQHGTMNPMGHHNGDLPRNISIGENHMGEASFKVDYLSATEGAPNSVIGHAIVVHEKADDMKTDPTGNAGNRIACGVIQ